MLSKGRDPLAHEVRSKQLGERRGHGDRPGPRTGQTRDRLRRRTSHQATTWRPSSTSSRLRPVASASFSQASIPPVDAGRPIVIGNSPRPEHPHLANRTVGQDRGILSGNDPLVFEPVRDPRPNLSVRQLTGVHAHVKRMPIVVTPDADFAEPIGEHAVVHERFVGQLASLVPGQ